MSHLLVHAAEGRDSHSCAAHLLVGGLRRRALRCRCRGRFIGADGAPAASDGDLVGSTTPGKVLLRFDTFVSGLLLLGRFTLSSWFKDEADAVDCSCVLYV